MAFDLMKWLTKDMGFTDDEAKTLAPQFNETRTAALAKGYMDRADYDRSRTELQTTSDQLTAEMAEWAGMKQRGEAMDAERAARIEALEADKARLTTRLTDVATRAGIDPKKALEGIVEAEPKPKPAEVPPVDPSKFVGRDDLGNVVGYLDRNAYMISAIQADHQALFGRPMTGDEIVALHDGIIDRVKQKKPTDARSLWEETFNVPAQRQKIAKDKYDADIKAAEDRGAERARTEQHLPTTNPAGSHAPIFKRPDGDPGSKLTRPSPARNVMATAEALRSGKYRNPQPAGAGR